MECVYGLRRQPHSICMNIDVDYASGIRKEPIRGSGKKKPHNLKTPPFENMRAKRARNFFKGFLGENRK